MNGPAKRKSGKTQMEEIMSGATEKVLKQVGVSCHRPRSKPKWALSR